MAYPYRVVLTEEQRAELRGLVGSGVAPARMLARARILLRADHGEGGPGWSDAAVAGALTVDPSTVLRVRRRFVADGLAATLERKRPDRDYARILDGEQEAHLVAVACAATADGADRWSLRLLQPAAAGGRGCAAGGGAGDLARDGAPDARNNAVKPWLVEPWRLAPTADPAFVWPIEDVLDVYQRPFDPQRPVVCLLDETSRQLLGEVRPPLLAAPGYPARHDPEYVRGAAWRTSSW